MSDFIHLHVHTEYSLLDGLSQIKRLVNRAKELKMGSLAISDHGVMYGAIEFYKACKDADINPIIGMEAYVSKEDHTIKDPQKKTNANHLLLLAKNFTGYQNLMKLTSIGHLDGFYYRPRFDKDTLKKYSEGLIVTSACPAGEIAEYLIAQDYDAAKQSVQWYLDVFGEDYYLELQRHEHDKYLPQITDPTIKQDMQKMANFEKVINDGIVKLSQDLRVPLVATNDAHYINQTDAEAQDALVCVATGCTIDQVDRLRYIDLPTFHIRTPDEMKQLFADHPESLTNTVKIADKCDISITLGEWYFPKPHLPKGKNEIDYLKERIAEEAPKRMGEITPEIQKRLDFELDTICSKGYAGYFLIYAQFADWTRQEGIITNTRGSAAGSLVSYILGITTVDPIRYLLPFERFLNPYRPSPPDIDLDIADNRRADMIEHITELFGHDKVAQICTFGRMKARAAVKDIARVMGYDFNFSNELGKMVPEGSQGFPMTIENALKESAELKARYDSEADVRRIIELAKGVEGNARHLSVHAAAVIAAPKDITNYAPLQRESKGDRVITQYEMHAAEDVGLIKFDILGITQLTIMNSCIDIIYQNSGKKIDLEQVPLDDDNTYEMLARGETLGVFQLGGEGMTKWLMELKPRKVEDIMAMIALYRPGPIANIPDYIARHHGEKPIEYFHPKAEKFLDKSYGILVYQDDLLYCALELAGYNWEEVDKFRKAVGKKIPEEMAKQHIKFVQGCQEHTGMTETEAEKLWDLFEPFQGYGFNKAHAASYGMVSYRSAYLKANYPVEFMAAMLTADSGDTDKITAGIADARRMNIEVLPPDINQSFIKFTVSPYADSLNGQAIRFGLSAIKNVGEAAVAAIIEAREEGEFTSLVDFLNRVEGRKVNKKVLESLIKVGAMDSFGNRAALLQVMEETKSQIDKSNANRLKGQDSLFGEDEPIQDSHSQNLPDVPPFTIEQKLLMEKELLGFYITENPVAQRLSAIKSAIDHNLADISAGKHYGKIIKVGGYIADARAITTKKGKQMAFATLADDTGEIELVVFPNLYAESQVCWQKDRMVLLDAKVDFRNDQLQLIVESASLITHTDGSNISLDDTLQTIVVPRSVNQQQLVKLNTLLKQNPGEDKIQLMFENGGTKPKTIVVPFGVDLSGPLRDKIQQLIKDPFASFE